MAWLEGDWTAFRSPTWDLPASAGSPLTRHADVIWRLSLASEWDALRAWRDLAESDAPVWLEGLESRGSGVESIGRFLVRAYLATVYYWTCDARASAEVATALELASAISRSRLHHWNIRELRSELAAYSGLLEGSRTSCARAADAARDALAALVGGMDSPARRPDLALLRLRALSTEEGGPGKAEFTAFVSAFPALRSRVSSLRGQAGGAW